MTGEVKAVLWVGSGSVSVLGPMSLGEIHRQEENECKTCRRRHCPRKTVQRFSRFMVALPKMEILNPFPTVSLDYIAMKE